MKKLFSSTLLITAILVLLQFGILQASGLQNEKPELVIKNYLNAVLSKDYQTASSFISDSNEDISEWLEFLNYVSNKAPKKLISMINLAHSLTRHQNIKTSSTNDESAVVKVESIVPDMEKILDITHSEDVIKALFKNSTLPLKQKQGTFILVNENNRWKINEVEGVSGDSAYKIAMDLADKLLSKEEVLKLKKDIKDYREGQT
jgi:hypothetical protein